MNQVQREEYVKYRLEKAIETIEVAELLIMNKKWNSAVNRLYYSAYYAISALLVYSEINTQTHSGVKTQFFLSYIKSGKLESKFGKIYSDLFDWRQKGDYGDLFDFQENDVNSIFNPTKELIKEVKKLINTIN